MSYEFRPAVRENASVIIGLAGASGSGKTLSALLLATGLAGPKGRIAYIDTERGRAKHYAPAPGQPADPSRGTFAFDYLELDPPFAPSAYQGAIEAADTSGAAVVVVDSFSHEWEGEGGVLDMREVEFARMNYAEKMSVTSWVKPKGAHKKLVNRMIQCRVHLIVCLRAQEKMKIVKKPGGGQEIIAADQRPIAERWEPICEKRFPYELTASFVLTPSSPGVPVPVKLQDQHRPFFPLDKQLGIAAGAGLAAWASGRAPGAPPAPSSAPAAETSTGPLTRGEVRDLEQLLAEARTSLRIKPSEFERYEAAIADRDATVVRAGIEALRSATV